MYTLHVHVCHQNMDFTFSPGYYRDQFGFYHEIEAPELPERPEFPEAPEPREAPDMEEILEMQAYNRYMNSLRARTSGAAGKTGAAGAGNTRAPHPDMGFPDLASYYHHF